MKRIRILRDSSEAYLTVIIIRLAILKLVRAVFSAHCMQRQSRTWTLRTYLSLQRATTLIRCLQVR